jgi:hypothetical protein
VTSGGSAFVAMMPSANFGARNDVALFRRLHPPCLWSIFVQAQVRPGRVIISEISFEQAMQVSSIQHDHMIQTITPNRTD